MDKRQTLVELQLQQWASELVDLRTSSPLLTLRSDRPNLLELVQPSPERIFNSFLVADFVPLRLVSAAPVAATEIVVARGTDRPVAKTLRAMREVQTTEQLAHGVHVVFIAFGTLIWSTQKEEAARSPLLIVPVQLDRPSNIDDYILTARGGRESLIFNPALKLKLAEDYRLNLDLPRADAGGHSLDSALEHVRDAIAAQRGWRVEESAHLGIFDFTKFALYEDLILHAPAFARRPLVRAMAQDTEALLGLPKFAGRPAELLDVEETPETVYQVLDADSSQRTAIDAVNQGASIVVEGPPGTGKSQTIANIVSESLARGKSVLFVSEKMAALTVVAKRLGEAGLGPYCLALHDESVNEASIVAELARAVDQSLTTITSNSIDDVSLVDINDLRRLSVVRNELNAYFGALCDTNTPLQRSAYGVVGEIAHLSRAPRLEFDYEPSLMGGLTPEVLNRLHQAIEQLVLFSDIVLRPTDHQWHIAETSIDQRDWVSRYQFTETLASLAEAARELQFAQVEIRSSWGLPPGSSLVDAVWLLSVLTEIANRGNSKVLAQWFSRSEYDAASEAASQHADGFGPDGRRRELLLEAFTGELFSPELLLPLLSEIDHDQMVLPIDERFRTQSRSGPTVPVRISAGLLRAEIAKAEEISSTFARQLGIDVPANAQEAGQLAKLVLLVIEGRPPLRNWFASGRLAELKTLAQEARDHAEALSHRSDLLSTFKPTIFQVATDELIERVTNASKDPLDRLLGMLYRDIWRLESHGIEKIELTHNEALDALSAAKGVRLAEEWFTANHELLDKSFDHHFTGSSVDWAKTIDALTTVENCISLVNVHDLPPGLVDFPPRFAFEKQIVHQLESGLDHVTSAWQMLVDVLPDGAKWRSMDFSNLSFEEVDRVLDQFTLASVDLSEPTRRLAHCRTAPWSSFSELTKSLREATELNGIEARLESQFGSSFQGHGRTDWSSILQSLGWVSRVRQHFGKTADIPEVFANYLSGGSIDLGHPKTDLSVKISRVHDLSKRASHFFRPDSTFLREGISNWSLEELAKYAETMNSEMPLLDRWLTCFHAIANAESLGLGPFIAALRISQPAPGRWRAAFDLQLLTLWLAWREKHAPVLTAFSSTALDSKCDEFALLDRKQVESAGGRVTRKLDRERKEALTKAVWANEIAVLRQSAYASEQPQPLRQIFKGMPNLLLILKPCVLMSPMAVARFLGESAILFDVVIFDEASQITPADGIGSLARGNQVVVVGDSKQMPPTGFFESGRSGTQNGLPQAESLLHLANMAGLPRKPLKWHYRSQHEQLISFSNQRFYDNTLVTFPSSREHIDPIEFVYVPSGIYTRGDARSNTIEAATLVDALVEHLEAEPNASIGVIAFSEAQMNAIQDEIDSRRETVPALNRLRPEAEPDGFFVRNLENVQGDERDVIFFSVGYGPDNRGVMTLNFGPLNAIGGERRLNVAITRARQRIRIFASFQPEQLAGSDNTGVKVLRDYLMFAREVPIERKARSGDAKTSDRSFKTAVADALREAGLTVATDVGESGFRIDIGIKENETSSRFLLGIECDGSSYSAARNARDRERLRQEVLARLGWRVHRVWSSTWLSDRTGEIKRIKDLIESILDDERMKEIEEQNARTDPAISIAVPVAIIPSFPVSSPTTDATVTPVPIVADDSFDVDVASAKESSPKPATKPGVTKKPVIPSVEAIPKKKQVPATKAKTPTQPEPVKIPASPASTTQKKPRASGHKDVKSQRLLDIKGMTVESRDRLKAAGVNTTEDLLLRAATTAGVRSLAKEVNASVKDLTDWINRADLMRINGIGTELANLFEEAGVDSCRELRRRVPVNLHTRLTDINTELAISQKTPTIAEVERWIAEAKRLAG